MKHAAWLIASLVSVVACDPAAPVGPTKIVDMKAASGDLAGVDMAMVTYMANLPTCTPVTITASQVYAGVVAASCSCHKTQSPRLGNAADLVNNLVNKMPRSAMMPLVTPGQPNRSYLMFRLTGQGDLIPGGNSGFMPLGGSMLNTSQMCQWVNWVRGGALP